MRTIAWFAATLLNLDRPLVLQTDSAGARFGNPQADRVLPAVLKNSVNKPSQIQPSLDVAKSQPAARMEGRV